MTEKILICEDSEIIARALRRNLESKGYATFTLAYEKDPLRIVDEIEEFIKKENPDYAIIDGLEGYCFKTAESALEIKPDLKVIIHSGRDDLIKDAKEKGYIAFEKSLSTIEMFDFLKEN